MHWIVRFEYREDLRRFAVNRSRHKSPISTSIRIWSLAGSCSGWASIMPKFVIKFANSYCLRHCAHRVALRVLFAANGGLNTRWLLCDGPWFHRLPCLAERTYNPHCPSSCRLEPRSIIIRTGITADELSTLEMKGSNQGIIYFSGEREKI